MASNRGAKDGEAWSREGRDSGIVTLSARLGADEADEENWRGSTSSSDWDAGDDGAGQGVRKNDGGRPKLTALFTGVTPLATRDP